MLSVYVSLFRVLPQEHKNSLKLEKGEENRVV